MPSPSGGSPAGTSLLWYNHSAVFYAGKTASRHAAACRVRAFWPLLDGRSILRKGECAVTRKRLPALLMLGLALTLPLSAAADAPLSAETLYTEFVSVGLRLTIDPQTDPLLTLVNRDHLLTSAYKPKVRTPKVRQKNGAAIDLQPEAAAALETMFKAAEAEGLHLVAISGYRSYGKQKTLYALSVERNGQEKADCMSARPGASEHQLGLAMDLSCSSLDEDLTSRFARKAEGKWVAAHCTEYGFIVRYREEWSQITGYQGEPWHIRYVGPLHAERIDFLGVPLETYVAFLTLVWQHQQSSTP